MPTHLIVICGVVTLVLSIVLPFIVRPILLKLRIMDVPNERSSHERPILRGLGLAVLISLTVVGSYATFAFFQVGDTVNAAYLLLVGVFSFASGLLGFGEDLKGVSVGVRSIFLLLIAVGASAATVFLGASYPNVWSSAGQAAQYSSAPATVTYYDLPAWLLFLIGIYGVFFISGFINVANFMDGLNGISGLHAIIAGLTFAAAGWLSGVAWLPVAGILLAAAFGGFLPWNLSKRGAFLGDVGSYLLGGSVAVISFAALASGVPLLAAIGPMVIYFGDVVVTLIRRVRAGHKWDEPHKEHVYQRLQQEGRSHLTVALIVGGFSAVTSLLGLASMFASDALWWSLYLLAGLVTLLVYLKLPKRSATPIG